MACHVVRVVRDEVEDEGRCGSRRPFQWSRLLPPSPPPPNRKRASRLLYRGVLRLVWTTTEKRKDTKAAKGEAHDGAPRDDRPRERKATVDIPLCRRRRLLLFHFPSCQLIPPPRCFSRVGWRWGRRQAVPSAWDAPPLHHIRFILSFPLRVISENTWMTRISSVAVRVRCMG